MEKFIADLSSLNLNFTLNEPMSRHTTFGIGGNADIFINVKTPEELSGVISLARKCNIQTTVIGNGSNLLVSDDGVEGAVVRLEECEEISQNGEFITCFAGTKLATLCKFAEKNSLAGLEFAYGIPGTVGGALYMNAGAYGGEIKDVVVSAECIDREGNISVIKDTNMCLGYRTSIFKKKGYTILSVTFKLDEGIKSEISANMRDYMERRISKQPLDKKSAGSTFKRPEGAYAGALIEGCGLKGFAVGDAEVSQKHAGFVVNNGNAKCSDVLCLIDKVQQKVKEETGYDLEPEVIFIGR